MSSAKRTSIFIEDKSRSEGSDCIGTSSQDFIVDATMIVHLSYKICMSYP